MIYSKSVKGNNPDPIEESEDGDAWGIPTEKKARLIDLKDGPTSIGTIIPPHSGQSYNPSYTAH